MYMLELLNTPQGFILCHGGNMQGWISIKSMSEYTEKWLQNLKKIFIGSLEYHMTNDCMCARKITENIFNKYFKNIKLQNKVNFVLVILVKTSS